MKSRWKIVCAYDGSDYSGWQSQADRTGVQDHIENALFQLIKEPVRIHCSGRTDAGVHARGQVFHFDADWSADASSLKRAIRTKLPASIMICSVARASGEFHARFSAVGKCYLYRVVRDEANPFERRFVYALNGWRFDPEKFCAAAPLFEGWHDFRAFAANRGKPYEDTWRYVAKCEAVCRGRNITLRVEGNGFMYKMVRSIAGALLSVAGDRMDPSEIRLLLQGDSRTFPVVTAPPEGLYLERVYYRNRNYPPRPECL
jgi:tRNA pseudouridine38-40 synthase